LIPVTHGDRPEGPELVSRAAAGEPGAQARLVALLGRRVRTVALAVLGHAADVDDTVQAALMEILGAAAAYRGGSLTAWADRITARTAIRHARQRRVRAAHLDPVVDVERTSVAPKESASDAIPRPILDYLAELPEARRTALVLRHVLDYSVEEIAELTEASPNTVKDRLLQARRQVRRSIRRELSCRPVPTRSDR
jgi:RNA polymerase sigma-70 factor (ECF subfamily)